MDEGPTPPPPLRSALIAALERATSERVDDLAFFRGPAQRGTGTPARVRLATRELVVKLPVTATELHWFRQLGERGDSVARLIASGDRLGDPVGDPVGDRDIRWIALERLPHETPLHTPDPRDTERLAAAAARFAHATRQQGDAARRRDHATRQQGDATRQRDHAARQPDECTLDDWPPRLEAAIAAVDAWHRTSTPAPARRWRALHALVMRELPALAETWRHRAAPEWIHGELHPRHARTRSAGPSAPMILTDLASVRRGHWIEDAIDLERHFWTQPDLLRAARPLRAIARARRAHGLPLARPDARLDSDGEDDDGYLPLARIRRLLVAAAAPQRPSPEPVFHGVFHGVSQGAFPAAFLAACLSQAERALRELGVLPPRGTTTPGAQGTPQAVLLETLDPARAPLHQGPKPPLR